MAPVDQILYNKVKELANEKFDEKTSAYKSSWIVREYKKRGGKYKGKKPNNTGLTRWYKEEWVDLNRPVKNKKGVYNKCGRTKKTEKYPLCRPSKRITKETPLTWGELSPKVIERALKLKTKTTRVKFG